MLSYCAPIPNHITGLAFCAQPNTFSSPDNPHACIMYSSCVHDKVPWLALAQVSQFLQGHLALYVAFYVRPFVLSCVTLLLLMMMIDESAANAYYYDDYEEANLTLPNKPNLTNLT